MSYCLIAFISSNFEFSLILSTNLIIKYCVIDFFTFKFEANNLVKNKIKLIKAKMKPNKINK